MLVACISIGFSLLLVKYFLLDSEVFHVFVTMASSAAIISFLDEEILHIKSLLFIFFCIQERERRGEHIEIRCLYFN